MQKHERIASIWLGCHCSSRCSTKNSHTEGISPKQGAEGDPVVQRTREREVAVETEGIEVTSKNQEQKKIKKDDLEIREGCQWMF